MRISEEMERGRESVLLSKGFPWRGRLPSEGPSRLLRVKAPLCRVVPRAANRNEHDCRWQSYLYCAVTPFGVTEGVYAADLLKTIVRYSPTKSLPYTPSDCPCGQPPPPTQGEAAPRRVWRIEFGTASTPPTLQNTAGSHHKKRKRKRFAPLPLTHYNEIAYSSRGT